MDTVGSKTRSKPSGEARSGAPNGNGAASLALALPEELAEAIAERAAEILAGRQPAAEDGWLRGAGRIAPCIDCPRSRGYALTSAPRIPVHRDGSALIAHCSELERWLGEPAGRLSRGER